MFLNYILNLNPKPAPEMLLDYILNPQSLPISRRSAGTEPGHSGLQRLENVGVLGLAKGRELSNVGCRARLSRFCWVLGRGLGLETLCCLHGGSFIIVIVQRY